MDYAILVVRRLLLRKNSCPLVLQDVIDEAKCLLSSSHILAI